MFRKLSGLMILCANLGLVALAAPASHAATVTTSVSAFTSGIVQKFHAIDANHPVNPNGPSNMPQGETDLVLPSGINWPVHNVGSLNLILNKYNNTLYMLKINYSDSDGTAITYGPVSVKPQFSKTAQGKQQLSILFLAPVTTPKENMVSLSLQDTGTKDSAGNEIYGVGIQVWDNQYKTLLWTLDGNPFATTGPVNMISALSTCVIASN